MNKQQKREVAKILTMAPTLGLDFMARSISALVRCAMTDKSRRELIAIAAQYRAYLSNEWTI
jgi:hypothetical protein